MHTFEVTIVYEVDIADAYGSEDVWWREQALLDARYTQLDASVVKVS